jgi:hypothetical protein
VPAHTAGLSRRNDGVGPGGRRERRRGRREGRRQRQGRAKKLFYRLDGFDGDRRPGFEGRRQVGAPMQSCNQRWGSRVILSGAGMDGRRAARPPAAAGTTEPCDPPARRLRRGSVSTVRRSSVPPPLSLLPRGADLRPGASDGHGVLDDARLARSYARVTVHALTPAARLLLKLTQLLGGPTRATVDLGAATRAHKPGGAYRKRSRRRARASTNCVWFT